MIEICSILLQIYKKSKEDTNYITGGEKPKQKKRENRHKQEYNNNVNQISQQMNVCLHALAILWVTSIEKSTRGTGSGMTVKIRTGKLKKSTEFFIAGCSITAQIVIRHTF